MEINWDKWRHILLLWYITISAIRYTLKFSKCNIKFGAVIYGIGKNNLDTYALPAGLALHVKNDLPFQGAHIDITYIHDYYVHASIHVIQ